MQQTVSNWFGKIRTDKYDLPNEPIGRPESKVNDEELKNNLESDSAQSTYSLTLAQIDKVIKFDRWIPVNEKQIEESLVMTK